MRQPVRQDGQERALSGIELPFDVSTLERVALLVSHHRSAARMPVARRIPTYGHTFEYYFLNL